MTYRLALYFKFADEAAAVAALPGCRESDGDGNPAWGAGVDAPVPVVKTAAVLDESGNVVTPAAIEPGYHLNLLVSHPEAVDVAALEAIDGWTGTARNDGDGWILMKGLPATPSRQWA